jgi:hypothetical protein
MMFAASTMLVSGVTEMTDRVMIWWARMGGSASSTNFDGLSLFQAWRLVLTQVKQVGGRGVAIAIGARS